MSSFLFDSLVEDMARSQVDFGADTIKVMLMGAKYHPSQRGHSRRADVLPYEASGSGYEAGGRPVDVMLSQDAGRSALNITFGGAAWLLSTVSARGAVYYKSRGGDPADDELVAYADFADSVPPGTPAPFLVSSFNGAFAVGESVAQLLNRPSL